MREDSTVTPEDGEPSSGSDVSLQIVRQTPAHLLALSPVPSFLLAACRAVAEAGASLEVLAALPANIGYSLLHDLI